MPIQGDPARIDWEPKIPTVPPITNRIVITAILAGSFFFVNAGDYVSPQNENVLPPKYTPVYEIINPYPKPTLSPAIRASICEQTLPAVDINSTYEIGQDAWDNPVAKNGINKWKGIYPDIVPARFHKELSPAIQSGSFWEVVPSQADKSWNKNSMAAAIVPADWAARNIDYYYPNKQLPAAIQAGSFFHVNFIDMVGKTWNLSTRNMMWLVETPEWQLRSKNGLLEAIQAGYFTFVEYTTLTTWVEDFRKESWRPPQIDIVPVAKKGLSEAIQATTFTQPPFMSLAINYPKNLIDYREENAQDQFPYRQYEMKKQLPAAIQAGSCFEVPPSIYPAKTWGVEQKSYGYTVEIPDLQINSVKSLPAAIEAGCFFFVEYGDHNSWKEDLDPSNWMPVYMDRYPTFAQLLPAIQSNNMYVTVVPASDAWASTVGGLQPNTVVFSLSDSKTKLYIGKKLVIDL